MTPEQMAACHAGGRYWYLRDGQFYGTDDFDGLDGYLLDASPEWVAQWDSWEHAVEVMTAEGSFAALEQVSS